MSTTARIGFLGGTGIEGKGLALRFAKAGVAVVIGSRSLERAQAVARALHQQLGSELITGTENREMISACEIIFLTVPFEQAATALDTYRDGFRPETVVVDVTVPVRFAGGRVELLSLPEGSGSQSLAKHLAEGVHLVGAFKTVPSHVLADFDVPLDCDVFVCGDSQPAKARAMEVIRLIPDVRPVDAGGLEAAGTLERMTLMAVGINRRYEIKTARFRVVGL